MGNMKFKVGDCVRIKSVDWYNRYTNGTEVHCGAYPFTSDMKEFCGQERIIANVYQECYVLLGIDDRFVWTDEMIEGLVENEMSLDEAGQITDFEYEGLAYTLPDGYQFVDENGNVINTTKIVLEKKKKEYPKTYEECAGRIMRVEMWNTLWGEDATEYEEQTENLIDAFISLKVCRDAYWKIAGEEMGLGKPWEPDWSIYEHKFCLGTDKDKVIEECVTTGNRILAFPTEEMRDAFKENFDTDIEICKEFL